MPQIKVIKTTAEALSEIERLSRLQLMCETLYTRYWEAGHWHNENERKELDRIITDIRSESSLLLQSRKRDFAESPMSLEINGSYSNGTPKPIVAQ